MTKEDIQNRIEQVAYDGATDGYNQAVIEREAEKLATELVKLFTIPDVVVVEYGEEDLYLTVKKGDFLTCLSDPSKTVIFNTRAPSIGKNKVFTILYDLPMQFNGKLAYTLTGTKFPFSNFRYSTEDEKALMVEEMEKLGKRYNPVTSKIEEKEPLFVTDDEVKVFDRNTIVYNVRNNTLAKIEISAVYLSKYDFEHKIFFHESSADEYIWRNKRLFSYDDIEKFQSGGEGVFHDIKTIAKERSIK